MFAIVGLGIVLMPMLLFGQEARHNDDLFLPHQYNDSLSVGNEAFTEPVEDIKVAAAEMGIVKVVHVSQGDLVAEGDLLMEMDMEVIEATRQVAESKANNVARLKAAEVELTSKNTRYEKLIELVREGAGSPEEVERARADSEVAQHNVDAIREETARYALEVRQYETQMERRRVRSPINGVVTELTKKPGEFISTNEPHVATVVRLDTLRARFHIPTERAVQIKQGDSVDVLFRNGMRTTAIVEYVSPVTRADSGRVELNVLIENGRGDHRSGISCRLLDDSVRQSSLDRSSFRRSGIRDSLMPAANAAPRREETSPGDSLDRSIEQTLEQLRR